MGNGEQSISREIYRLSQLLDGARLLSFYYSSNGYFINQSVLCLAVYILM